MKVTAQEEYGLRCMVLLARRNSPASLSEISAAEGLSIAYSGKLLSILRKAELVNASRGRNGGYSLTRSAEDISLFDILQALGKRVFSAAHCDKYRGDNDSCVHIEDCSVRVVWRGFDKFLSRFLKTVTLAELADGEIDMGALEIESVATVK
jgi:Rrf2 family iron-sulfur cluster assembly transcriptional regulator